MEVHCGVLQYGSFQTSGALIWTPNTIGSYSKETQNKDPEFVETAMWPYTIHDIDYSSAELEVRGPALVSPSMSRSNGSGLSHVPNEPLRRSPGALRELNTLLRAPIIVPHSLHWSG